MQVDLEVALRHLATQHGQDLAQKAGELAMTAAALEAAHARIAELEAATVAEPEGGA